MGMFGIKGDYCVSGRRCGRPETSSSWLSQLQSNATGCHGGRGLDRDIAVQNMGCKVWAAWREAARDRVSGGFQRMHGPARSLGEAARVEQ